MDADTVLWKRALATTKTVVVVLIQGALLLLAMTFAFVPFSYAPSLLGYPVGYLTYLLYPLLLYLLVWIANRWFNRVSIRLLGFSPRGLLPHFALGLGLGALSVLGVVGLTALLNPQVSLRLSGLVGFPGNVTILLADVWETSFSEEFLVRGFVLPALLRRRMGQHAAALWSAFMFALAHFLMRPLWWLIPIAVTGVFLGYLYYATGSIWAPVGCHLAMNLVIGLLNRGILLQALGIEQNLPSLAVLQCGAYLAITALLWQVHRRRVEAGVTDSRSHLT
jgi:membrane protease YdiL (CAAX protease family)